MEPISSEGACAVKPEFYLSIVVRVRNEARTLRQLLEALAAQRCSFNWEIIVVDNESEDGLAALCEQYNARVVGIRRDEFTYGRALNFGIREARGELVLLCSAHVVPVGSYFLECAVAPFVDPEMAAVRCLGGSQLSQWYKARDIQYGSLGEQKVAETGTKWLLDYPTAACCVIRRSIWEQIPFDEHLEAQEDKLWASQVLRRGFKIRSCAEAMFVYTRRRRGVDRWRVMNRQYKALYRITGYIPSSWPRFFLKVLRAALLAPLVALRYFIHVVMSEAYLVIIPWQSKCAERPGSVAEYDKPVAGR
jgi:glycosyltransferase involved in cell wall biosynthesis